jgi:phosphoribosylformylglycinamidine (FGAM) synthase-like amidotransferase family enzyme
MFQQTTILGEHVKERYAEVVCNGFQVLTGLGFVEYGVNCEVFWVTTMQVLGSTLWRS